MIDLTGLELTLHKGMAFGNNALEDLYIYKDYLDGTGILTDGINCYFAYTGLLALGDLCPQDAKFLNAVEEIILTNAVDAIATAGEFKNANPNATDEEVMNSFKAALNGQGQDKG